MRRREFITLASSAAIAWPLAARAEQSVMPAIGFLLRSSPVRSDFADFRDGLRALGYEEGRNIRIEQRYADLNMDRLRELARELVALDVKVIVVDGFATIQTVMATTKTIPIVSALIAGPDQFAIASLARPGGNLTGLSVSVDELGAKRLELLKELVPNAHRVAVLRDRYNVNTIQLRGIENVAKVLGVGLREFEAAEPPTWPGVFDLIADYKPDAMLQLTNATFATDPARLVALAVAQRLPVVYGEREFVDAGGLMSLGVSFSDQWRRAAGYVEKILKGSKPGDLPIEQPTRFDLVINLKTAKSMAFTVPTPTLLRATEIIE
jgi:putative tryptophan/tyrosine transport system substrate-binding protein